MKRDGLLVAGALLGATGVAAGALGAHALRSQLSAEALRAYETAVLYQLLHAVALLAIAGLPAEHARARWGGALIAAGVVLFSGSIYGLVLGGPRLLGPVTPIGGTAMILGWLMLGASAACPTSLSRDAR